MRTYAWVLTALLTAMLLLPAPLVGAQEHSPHPNVEQPILWAHATNDPECCDYWMSGYSEDPASTGTNPGGDPTTGHTWELPFEPGLLGAVHLDPDTPITIVAYIGGSASYGLVDVTTELRNGDTLVAQGEAESLLVEAAGDGAYERLEWEITPSVETLDASQDLVWIVEAEGIIVSTGGSTSVFMGMSEGRGKSHIVLPITSVDYPADTTATFSDHEDETFLLQGDETEPVDVLHTANWTVGPVDATLTLETDITNGTLQLEVRDADNQTIVDETQSEVGPQTMNLTLEDTTAGNWTLNLRLTDFVGEYSIQIAPVQETTPGDDTGDGDTTDTQDNDTGSDAPDGNETTGEVDDEEGFLPGPGGVALVMITALVLQALRRTRRTQDKKPGRIDTSSRHTCSPNPGPMDRLGRL